MATTRTVGTLGDHATIADAISWGVANHSWDTDGILTIQLIDNAEYAGGVEIPFGSTWGNGVEQSNISSYLHITAAPSVRHNGTVESGARVYQGDGSHVIEVGNIDYTYISDLEIKQQSSANSAEGIRLGQYCDNALLSRNIIWTESASDDQDGVYTGNWPASYCADNNIIFGFDRGGFHLQNYNGGSTHVVKLDHNTVFECGSDDTSGDGGVSVTNASGTTVDITVYNTASLFSSGWSNTLSFRRGLGGTFSAAGSNNADSDGSVSSQFGLGTANQENLAPVDTTQSSGSYAVFTDLSDLTNPDLSLLDNAAGNLLYQTGVSRVGSEPDPRQDFSFDIVGTSRDGSTPCIGAFEYASGGSTTGTITTTEQDDTSSTSGELNFSGTLAAQSDNDLCVASGSILSSVSGSLSVTEENDSPAISGELNFSGTINAQSNSDLITASGLLSFLGSASLNEGDDSAASSGVLALPGSLSVSEESDSAVISGELNFSGTVAAQSDNDVVNASGAQLFSGSISEVESDDSCSASGASGGISGYISTSEGSDQASASGDINYSGTIAAQSDNDLQTASGVVTVYGTLSSTEGSDTASLSGTANGSLAGTISYTEISDTASLEGDINYSGTVSAQSDNDLSTSSGTVTNYAEISYTEADDTFVIAGVSGAIVIAGSFTEESDTASASGNLLYSGTVAATGNDDISIASGVVSVNITGSAAVVESNDTSAIQGSSQVSGTSSLQSDDDFIAVTGVLSHQGSILQAESNDTSSAAGNILYSGTVAAQSDDDFIVAVGGFSIIGSLQYTESSDFTQDSVYVSTRQFILSVVREDYQTTWVGTEDYLTSVIDI